MLEWKRKKSDLDSEWCDTHIFHLKKTLKKKENVKMKSHRWEVRQDCCYFMVNEILPVNVGCVLFLFCLTVCNISGTLLAIVLISSDLRTLTCPQSHLVMLEYVSFARLHLFLGWLFKYCLWIKYVYTSVYRLPQYYYMFQGMEKCKELGLAKSIGVSNFNHRQLQKVLDNCTTKPSNIQVHTEFKR